MKHLIYIGLLLLSVAASAQDSSLSFGITRQYYEGIRFLDDDKHAYHDGNEAVAIGDSLNRLLNACQERYRAESAEYAECVLWAAHICVQYDDNIQGKQLLEKSQQVFRQYGSGCFAGKDTINEIFALDIEARIEEHAGRDYMALRYAKRACELKKAFFGERSEVYLHALLEVSRLYAERLQYKQANYYHNLGYTAYVERLKTEFCATSETGRIEYWEKAKHYINKTIAIAHRMSSISNQGGSQSIASAAYNALLLSKGLMLNTSNSFESFVNESGNTEAVELLQTKKLLAARQTEQSVLDSLDIQILKALERAGQPFRLPQLDIRWQDVTANIGKNDLAVEFYRTTQDEYGAIVLKKGWKSPKVIRLNKAVRLNRQKLSLTEAMKRCNMEYYSEQQADELWQLSRAVWNDEIVNTFPRKGQGCVYFAADGDLQITGIEYMPFIRPEKDGHIFSVADLYSVHRLSSTRELAKQQQESSNTDVAVYGGLRYDAEANEQTVGGNKSRALRKVASIDYLEGTLTEADSIISLLDKAQTASLNIHAYTGEKGTESSFKTLTDKHPKLIHIATHGFFFNAGDDMILMLDLGNNPMARSGLLLAGVEQKWFGLDVPDSEDGILTALEIANMDLRGLDLVALSACETGKGEVLGDGVFGLQRGFKIAGANGILMSLWKVDDDATCMLMTEFYRNWITHHMSKHDALQAAIHSVRTHTDKGWDNPKYWAAFILLDGLK